MTEVGTNMKDLCVPREEKVEPMRPILGVIPPCNVSDQFFYLQLKFTPKIGHTFTDEREVVVEVPKDLVQRKSESIKECLREVVALGLARSAALGTFPTEAERAVDLYDEDPPIWYYDRRPSVANSLGMQLRLLCGTDKESKSSCWWVNKDCFLSTSNF